MLKFSYKGSPGPSQRYSTCLFYYRGEVDGNSASCEPSLSWQILVMADRNALRAPFIRIWPQPKDRLAQVLHNARLNWFVASCSNLQAKNGSKTDKSSFCHNLRGNCRRWDWMHNFSQNKAFILKIITARDTLKCRVWLSVTLVV